MLKAGKNLVYTIKRHSSSSYEFLSDQCKALDYRKEKNKYFEQNYERQQGSWEIDAGLN